MKRFLLVLLFLLVSCGDCGEPDPPPPCTSDGDCRMGERCAMDGRCVVGAECVNDQECVASDPRKLCNLETFTCDFREGFGDECDATRPCPFGQFCSNLLGLCLDNASARDCTRRAQCPTNQICDREANKCIPNPGCFGDQFCEAGEICDLVTHTCRAFSVECTSCVLTNMCSGELLCFSQTKECLVSEQDAACTPGETCDPLGRCVQCTSSQQCGPGLFCNVAVGRCESNVQCAPDPSLCPDSPEVTCVMCELPEVCDQRTRRCQAPPTICESDIDCPNEQVCDVSVEPSVCVPRIPDCLNDVLEGTPPSNNNNIAAATLLPASQSDFIELKICPGDVDWYRIDVDPGTFLTIDARFAHNDGDLELQLLLPDGRTLIDESRSVTDNERVEVEVGTPLTFFLKVFLGVPTVRDVPYRLVIARDPAPVCMDDGNEPDDGPIDGKVLVSDMPHEGRLCPADPDWFVLRNVAAGTRIQASLDFVDSLGDLDLEIYRGGQPVPTLVANSTDDGETLTFDASFGGDFFLRVLGKGADTNVYTLFVQLREGEGGACLDDRHEPNETPQSASATTAAVNRVSELTICAGDEDWFQVHLNPNEAIWAELGFDAYADLDMALYPAGITDPNVTPLEVSNGTWPREFITRRFRTGGDFLLRVHGHRQQDMSPYELDLRTIPMGACMPDRVDQIGRGDDQMDPFFLPFPPFRETSLTLCGGDVDWFRIFLPTNFANYLSVHFNGSESITDFELWQGTNFVFATKGECAIGGRCVPQNGGFPCMTDADCDQPFPNHREVLITLPGNVGVAVAEVRVLRTTGMNGDYSLSLDLLPVFGCVDDRYEPNDSALMPSLAASSSTAPVLLTDPTLCATGNDEDWYLLNPPAEGSRVRASVDFTDGDLLMELFSPGAVARACVNFGPDRCYSDGNGLSEMVTFTATTTQPYLLRVSSIYSAPGVPAPPDIDTGYQLRVEWTP